MDEEAWLSATDPQPMLEFLRGRVSDRKLRLFACACCRQVWESLTTHRCRQAVETAEQYADGLATERDLIRAYSLARGSANGYQRRIGLKRLGLRDRMTVEEGRHFFACDVAHVHKPFLIGRLRWLHWDEHLRAVSPGLLRDLVTNPFAPPPHLDPAWLQWQDATVLRMAQAIYEDRAFDRMPLLGDALMDAGCDEEAVLAHCREQGSIHARGCWVLDLLLNKS